MRIGTGRLKKLVFRGFMLCLTLAIFPPVGVGHANAEVLLQDDFEDAARSEKIWTFKNPPEFRVVTDPKKAYTGSGVLEMIYNPNTTGPGFEYAVLPKDSQDLYTRFYQKLSPNWYWSNIADKIYAYYPASTGTAYIFWWAQFQTGLLEANWQQGVDSKSSQNLGRNTPMIPGVWQCIEMRSRRSSAGQADGISQLWIDGVMVMDDQGFDQGSQQTEPWHQVMISGYHNKDRDGNYTIPETQYRYIDDFVVSTQRIGCLPDTGDKTPPEAPTGVRINIQ